MQDNMEVLSDEPIAPALEVVGSDALQSLERASIDMQITTARKYPRNLKVVVHKMEQAATLDEETAQSCFYRLPRGQKSIEGPSVRLAEIALNSYGNLRFAARNISVVATGDQPHVICQAVVHDLENNVLGAVEKRRRITAKKKNNGKVDEDDIQLAVNACSSIALRDATFKVVPLALVKPVYQKARKVAVGDAASLKDRRNKMFDTFLKMGISKERVLASVEKQIEDEIGLEELADLIGVFTSIRDGNTNIDDAFPEVKTASAPKLTVVDKEEALPQTQQAAASTTAPAKETAKPKTAKAKTVSNPEPAKAATPPPAAPQTGDEDALPPTGQKVAVTQPAVAPVQTAAPAATEGDDVL